MWLNKTNFRLFFELLRAGIEGKEADPKLFFSEKEVDWKTLYQFAEEQTIIAIVWDGMLTLPEELHPERAFFYHWLGKVLSIERLNKQINKTGLEVIKSIEDRGIPVALLKGQGTATLYPNPSHRTPGDIDIYTGKGYTALEKILPEMGFKRIRHSTKHSEYQYKGVIVENHRHVALFFSPWLAWRLRRMVKEWFPKELHTRKIEAEEVSILPPWFEALFGVIHFRAHLHLEGIGWRQLCDWALIKRKILLKKAENDLETERYRQGLHNLNLEKTEAVMEELFETLVVQNKDAQTLSPMTYKVYEEMMTGGNFGHHTENAHTHLYAGRKGFWSTLWNLTVHDTKRSIRFFSLFPDEAIFSPFFRIGGYIRRRGK